MRKPFAYNLPKGYLSYSAMTLWMKDPDAYRARYYRNEEGFDSEPMRFGKKIAEILESRDYKDYPYLSKVPVYPISEHPLDVWIEDGLLVKGRLDLFDPAPLAFGEVKTGNSSAWDMVKVLKHEQMPFYSLLIKIANGKVESKCRLIWIETRYKTSVDQVGSVQMEGESKELELTGKVEIFDRRIAEWERTRIKRMIIKCAREITLDFNDYLKKTA